jgi:hypothetical protein
MVGMAVRWGAFRRGGHFYQLLAVVLTYFAIASTYVPDILQGMHQARANAQAEGGTPGHDQGKASDGSDENSFKSGEAEASRQGTVAATEQETPLWIDATVAFAFALTAPFLMGTSNIIGWIIIAFGLMQAWRLNGRMPIQIAGPFPAGARLPSRN